MLLGSTDVSHAKAVYPINTCLTRISRALDLHPVRWSSWLCCPGSLERQAGMQSQGRSCGERKWSGAGALLTGYFWESGWETESRHFHGARVVVEAIPNNSGSNYPHGRGQCRVTFRHFRCCTGPRPDTTKWRE